MTHRKSTFERFDLDPRSDPTTLTEQLRELAEEARDPARRAEIRAAWEELTRHPLRRLEAALDSHPESRPSLGSPPPRAPALEPAGPLDPADLVTPPRATDALPPPSTAERAMLGPPPFELPLGARARPSR